MFLGVDFMYGGIWFIFKGCNKLVNIRGRGVYGYIFINMVVSVLIFNNFGVFSLVLCVFWSFGVCVGVVL